MEGNLVYIFNIALVLLAANIGGIISKKIGQPEVLGQIIIGIILGAGILTKTVFLEELGEIGVIFLMFIAGLETEVDELKESGKSSSMIAIGGVIIPGILVSLGAYLLTQNMLLSLFLGLISAATSVSISVQTLREIGHLRSREGIAILGAAIIDDVIGIILLTLAVGIFKPAAGSSVIFVIFKIVLFFIVVVVIGKIINYALVVLSTKVELDEKIVSLAVIVCLMLAFLSEEMGVAAITGAYFSGVVFSMTEHRHEVSHEISKMATVFFTPIFFVVIGMGVDLRVAFSAIGAGSIIIILAILGKIIGSGLGAKLSGFKNNESLQIGIGMVPRAEVAIIIAKVGLNLELINNHVMAIVILMVVVTTLITPTLLKWSFER